MKAFVEHLSGIVRVGPDTDTYGKPFDFAVAYSSIDGKTATLKALVNPNGLLLASHLREVLAAMKREGFEHCEWQRFK